MLIPIDSIARRTNNVRTIKDSDAQSRLQASMAAHGQLQAVNVTRLDGGDSYELNAGNCRLDAAISLGWKEIDAKISEGLTEEAMREINLVENLIRAEVHAADYAVKIKNIVDSGTSRKSLAASLGLTVGMIGHFVRVASCGAYGAWYADAKAGKETPPFRDMITISARGEEALAAYEQLQASRKAASQEIRGVTAEEGEGEGEGEGEAKGKGGKGVFGRQSGQVLYEERKFFRRLCKGFEKDPPADNPATGVAPTKREKEKAFAILEALEWATKAKKDLAPPSDEYREEEVVEEAEAPEAE